MADMIKVFDIGTDVSENSIDEKQRKNILNLFAELDKETHLITNCYLNEDAQDYRESPIYYLMSVMKKNILIIKRLPKTCYELNVKQITLETVQYGRDCYL